MVDLRESLLSDDDDVVMSAMSELDALLRKFAAGGEYIPVLCKLLSRRDEIRTKALWCIGKLGQNKQGDEQSLDIICSLTEDQDAENRENAAWALGELAGAGLGDRDSLFSIIRLLDDSDGQVRGMAAWSVGRYADKLKIADEKSILPLERMTGESSTYCKKSAEFALERVGAILPQGP